MKFKFKGGIAPFSTLNHTPNAIVVQKPRALMLLVVLLQEVLS